MKKSAFKKTGINSAVLWRGPSELTGEPIVLIGISKSGNTKTGNMVQTYILRDDMPPVEANRRGLDTAICGDCPLKGEPAPEKETGTAKNRPCYVVLGQGPTVVFKTFDRGGYPALYLEQGTATHSELLADWGRDQNIRAGTYGDPAAVPVWVWDALLSKARGNTGYSHQMNNPRIDRGGIVSFCMVSVDNERDAVNHWRKGRRTFRIVQNVGELIPTKEIICPATPEGGNRTNCTNCNLCAGSNTKAKSVAVVAHGSGAKYTARPKLEPNAETMLKGLNQLMGVLS